MEPVQPGSLFGLITKELLPPAEAPFPPLTESEVAEPPLPPVAKIAPASSPNAGTKSPQGNSQQKIQNTHLKIIHKYIPHGLSCS